MLFDMLQAGLCFVIYFIMSKSSLFFLQMIVNFHRPLRGLKVVDSVCSMLCFST